MPEKFVSRIPTPVAEAEFNAFDLEPMQGAFALIFCREEDGPLAGRLQVLLVYRDDYHIWNLPGGSVERGEWMEMTVVREVEEETGLKVKKISTYGVVHDDPHKGEQAIPSLKRSDVYGVFICSVVGGAVQLTNEGQRIQWFPIDELPENTYIRHRDIIVAAAADEDNQKDIEEAIATNTFVPEGLKAQDP